MSWLYFVEHRLPMCLSRASHKPALYRQWCIPMGDSVVWRTLIDWIEKRGELWYCGKGAKHTHVCAVVKKNSAMMRKENDRHLSDDIFNCIFSMKTFFTLIYWSLILSVDLDQCNQVKKYFIYLNHYYKVSYQFHQHMRSDERITQNLKSYTFQHWTIVMSRLNETSYCSQYEIYKCRSYSIDL